jgi:hypothetical protein
MARATSYRARGPAGVYALEQAHSPSFEARIVRASSQVLRIVQFVEIALVGPIDALGKLLRVKGGPGAVRTRVERRRMPGMARISA